MPSDLRQLHLQNHVVYISLQAEEAKDKIMLIQTKKIQQQIKQNLTNQKETGIL